MMGSVRRSNWRQFLPYLLLNVIVSALTAFFVFQILGRPRSPSSPEPTATLDVAARVASAVPTATLTLEPSPIPATYTVQPGDTLYAIAQMFDIQVADLMEANGLKDPNALEVGQELILPGIDPSELIAEADESPPAPQGTTESAVTPQPDVEAPRVEILGVTGVGNLEGEVVRILNTGGVAHMAGWSLDDGGDHVYYFPVFSLHNGAVSVHTKEGTDTVIDLYWGLDKAVWKAGVVVTLRDASGAVQSTLLLPGG